MSKNEIFAENLTATGYGKSKEEILAILNKLTEDEVEALAYVSYRLAEKCGPDYFSADEVVTEEEL